MKPTSSGGNATPGPDGSMRLVINGAELIGTRWGEVWSFASLVGDATTHYPGTVDPAPVIEQFTRAAIAADPGLVGALGLLRSALALQEGGAP